MSIISPANWTGKAGVIGTYTDPYTDDLKEFLTMEGIAHLWRPDDGTVASSILTLPNRVPGATALVANNSTLSPAVADDATVNDQPMATFVVAPGTKQLQATTPVQLSTTAFTAYFFFIPTELSGKTLFSQGGSTGPGLHITTQSTGAVLTRLNGAGGGTQNIHTSGRLVIGIPVLLRVSWNSTDGKMRCAYNGTADSNGGMTAGAAPGTIAVTQLGASSGAGGLGARIGQVAIFNGVDHSQTELEDAANYNTLIAGLKYDLTL